MSDRHPRGPEAHNALKKELGVSRVDQVTVLAPNNDPFYKGSPAHWRDARWFADLWERFGYSRGVHLRRVHYQVLSNELASPDGTPYENTEGDWTRLCMAGAAARILGLVDPEAFEDRRNEPARRYVEPREYPPSPGVGFDDWDGWHLPSFSLDRLAWSSLDVPELLSFGYGYHADDQPVLVEVWIEKTTMNDVLDPLCRGANVNLVAGAGNESITQTVRLLRRAEAHDKPAHVIYVSDFDPAGAHMPVAVARQAQFWAETLDIGAELTIEPVALTAEQVREHQLPRTPIKDTDRRKAGFEERNGAGAVELDALEALHPGVLATVVRHAISEHRDPDLHARLMDTDADAQAAVNELWHAETRDIAAELEQIDGEVSRIVDEFRPQLDALNRALDARRMRLYDLAERTRQRADETPFPLPMRPEPNVPHVDPERFMYDSRRHWLDQLARFRREKTGDDS